MRSQFLKSARNDVRYWWISLINGLIALILGIGCIFTPDITLVALTYIFILAFTISGIIEIVFAISNRHILHDWGWSLAFGIIDVLFSILLFILPRTIITAALVYLVGFWIMFRSIWAIIESYELHQLRIRRWGWLLAFAIISLLFSIFFLLSPLVFKGAFVVALVSIALIVYGIFRIYLAFRLRSIHKEIEEEIKKDIEEYL